MGFVEFQNVSFSYNEGYEAQTRALENVSFSVEEGEFVALVGHNGSGKSTVAKLMNALLLPSAGRVIVDGMDTSDKKSLFEIRKRVGVVFQNPDNQMIATIIEDDVAFGPENIGLKSDEIRKRVDWALEAVGMSEHKKGTPFRLSGGQKQRIAIAGVLAVKPRVLVLDESTAMLDPSGREEVMSVVERLNREEKMTVVMITHFMDEALKADRMIVLSDGKVLMNGGRELFERTDEIKRAGLDLPVAGYVADKLRKSGVPLPSPITDENELVEALCRLKFKN
ncbi:MAG: energy-coupling factor transporter ATPase [Clostridia bacterium]|nr:energy-coupling factor transporter ATPase [Clostridia bacterium]